MPECNLDLVGRQKLDCHSICRGRIDAIIKGACEAIGIFSILEESGIHMESELYADASAALGIVARTGLGKLRHLDTSVLWMQQPHVKEKIKFVKIHGPVNPADLGTKALKCEDMDKHI